MQIGIGIGIGYGGPAAVAAGETLGPELVTNGGFDDATGWELGGLDIGATISGGKLRGDNSDLAWGERTAADTLVVGTYRVTFDIDSGSAFGVTVRLAATTAGGSPGGTTAAAALGANSQDVVVSSIGGQYITFILDTTSAVVDNLSVKQIL